MHIRHAMMDDLDILLVMEQGLIEAERPCDKHIKSGHCSYYDIPHLISSEQACMLVAEQDGQPIGCGYGEIRPSKEAHTHEQHCYLGFMYVNPEHRGKGIVPQLMQEIFAWSKAKGVMDFYLDVYADNPSAIRAYEKLGFAPCLVEMKMSL